MNKEKYLNTLTSKYNWFTPETEKKNIPDYIKISYVYCHGDIFEVFKIIDLFEYELLKQAYDYVENDWFAFTDKRKWVVFNLLEFKKNGNL